MINPCLIDKEVVARLKEKSKICFGSLWKFRKLADKVGATHEQIEEQMDAIINYKETEPHAPNRRRYTRKDRRIIQRHFAKQQRKKIRSEQAGVSKHIDDTSGGIE